MKVQFAAQWGVLLIRVTPNGDARNDHKLIPFREALSSLLGGFWTGDVLAVESSLLTKLFGVLILSRLIDAELSLQRDSVDQYEFTAIRDVIAQQVGHYKPGITISQRMLGQEPEKGLPITLLPKTRYVFTFGELSWVLDASTRSLEDITTRPGDYSVDFDGHTLTIFESNGLR